VLVHNLGLFCLFVLISLHSKYFFCSFYSFQCFINCYNIKSFGESVLRLKLHICDIYCVGTICFGILLNCIVCNFWKVHFTAVIMPNFFFWTNKNLIFFRIFLAYLVGYFCRVMFANSPQCRVRQRTEEDVAAFRARIMNRAVIPKRNVICTDLLVAPLDSINEIIQTYHWGYIHNCVCVVLTKLVWEFYVNLEVVQNDDNGIVL
jgi:hypothetical protein